MILIDVIRFRGLRPDIDGMRVIFAQPIRDCRTFFR